MNISAADNKLNGIYTDLTAQIRQSVETIKQKSDFAPQVADSGKEESKRQGTSFSVGNFAFSYLEPTTAYNIHVFSSQNATSEDINKEQSRQPQVEEEEEKLSHSGSSEVEEASFWEELQNHIAANYEQISRLYQRHDMGSYSDIPLFIEGNGYKGYDAAYAAQIYNFTFNLNKEADTRIEYMYKNNKSYDYRI